VYNLYIGYPMIFVSFFLKLRCFDRISREITAICFAKLVFYTQRLEMREKY